MRLSPLLARGMAHRATTPIVRRCLAAPTLRRHVRDFSSAPIANDEHHKPAIRISMHSVSGEAAPESMPDPFALVSEQLRPLDGSLRDLVGSDHPVLTRVAQHFFELAGKRFRPTIVLLASSAANGGAPPNARQTRLAEITEMIHAASLLHDDVIDLADTRRGAKAAHRLYGNKLAVLGGDFLLARASVLLSRLGDVKVVELLATVIEEMVQGELMQVKAMPSELLEFDHYLSKTYRKTAALISLSCQARTPTPRAPPPPHRPWGRFGWYAHSLTSARLAPSLAARRARG